MDRRQGRRRGLIAEILASPLKPFAELSVLEHGGSQAGAYCAKLFADLGARVAVTGPDRLTDAQRLYVRRRTSTVSADRPPDDVDVIIDSEDQRPLPPAEAVDPGVVRVRLGHHGPTGPYADWIGTDLTDHALGGHLYLYGHPDRPPLQGPANQPAMPGYGRRGPAVDWLAYGSTVDSHAGLSGLIGYADACPWKGGVAWPDPMAGLHATCGLLKAL